MFSSLSSSLISLISSSSLSPCSSSVFSSLLFCCVSFSFLLVSTLSLLPSSVVVFFPSLLLSLFVQFSLPSSVFPLSVISFVSVCPSCTSFPSSPVLYLLSSCSFGAFLLTLSLCAIASPTYCAVSTLGMSAPSTTTHAMKILIFSMSSLLNAFIGGSDPVSCT